jgi:hypothetical protein
MKQALVITIIKDRKGCHAPILNIQHQFFVGGLDIYFVALHIR